MLDVIISLEATCDLDAKMIKENKLSVINMNFEVDGEQFNTEKDDVVSSLLYEKMVQKKKTGTSQINAYDYEEHFVKLLKSGKDVLHLAFSSGLSGTGEVAKLVAEDLNKSHKNKIYVIDSLCACSGHGLLGIIARDYAKKCDKIDELIEFIETIKHKMYHLFTVDTLTYLANGGRVDGKKAFFGNLLNIKPVMQMNKEGKLEVMHKVISRKKSISVLASMTGEKCDKEYDYCFISHANCLEDAFLLKKKIEETTAFKPVLTNLGAVIGCHSGPGTLAVYFIGKEDR